jgi:transcription antitermination factor NusG
MFARFSPQIRLSVISTPGILRVLGDEAKNMISNAELEKIRAGLAAGLLMRPHKGVAVGTRVRVREGVFAGVEGLVTEFRHQCRVVITLSAVHQCFSLEVGLDDLTILNKPQVKPGLKSSPAFVY